MNIQIKKIIYLESIKPISIKRCVLVVSLLALTACAQSPIKEGPVKNYDTTIYESVNSDGKTLFDQIGGMDVIQKVMTEAVDGFKQDPRLAESFAETPTPRLAAFLSQQLCQLAQGPCEYTGMDMVAAHRGMNVTESQFIALVEVLQVAIRNNNLSFRVENKILALFAPMKPAILDK